MQVFKGLKQTKLAIRITGMTVTANMNEIARETSLVAIGTSNLHESLEGMYKHVCHSILRMRTKWKQTHNARTNVLPFHFSVGDYVMVHPANVHHSKLASGWIGPMHILDTDSDLVFVVEDLHKFKLPVVHAQQLLPYSAQDQSCLIQKEVIEYVEFWDASMRIVDDLHDLRLKDEEYEIEVS